MTTAQQCITKAYFKMYYILPKYLTLKPKSITSHNLSGDVCVELKRSQALPKEQMAILIQETISAKAIICQIITYHCIISTRITHTQGIMGGVLTSARQRQGMVNKCKVFSDEHSTQYNAFTFQTAVVSTQISVTSVKMCTEIYFVTHKFMQKV